MLPAENIEIRARIRAIPILAEAFPEQAKYLRNGSIPPECEEIYKKILSEETYKLLEEKAENTKPLGFVEQCAYGTWFEMNPEKVAGVERLMTSLAFPVSIKGNEDDVKLTIKQSLSKPDPEKKETKEISSKQKAKSQLVKIHLTDRHANLYDAFTGEKIKTLRRENRTAFLRLFEDYPNFIERYELKQQLTTKEKEQIFPSERFKRQMDLRQLARVKMKELKKI